MENPTTRQHEESEAETKMELLGYHRYSVMVRTAILKKEYFMEAAHGLFPPILRSQPMRADLRDNVINHYIIV